MDWINVLFMILGGLMILGIVFLAVRGWVKYPEERGKGGFGFNNSVPGIPPLMFDRKEEPEVPRLVIPSERDPGA